MIIFFNDVHFLNEPSPIEETELGIFISFNKEQLLKALSPIYEIVDGICICDKLEHPSKHPSPISILLYDIKRLIIFWLLSLAAIFRTDVFLLRILLKKK